MSVALKFIIILQNLTATDHRKSGERKYDRKLTELDVRPHANPVPCKRGLKLYTFYSVYKKLN